MRSEDIHTHTPFIRTERSLNDDPRVPAFTDNTTISLGPPSSKPSFSGRLTDSSRAGTIDNNRGRLTGKNLAKSRYETGGGEMKPAIDETDFGYIVIEGSERSNTTW